MAKDDLREPNMEALIEAIWGSKPLHDPAPPIDPAVREQQNRALAAALTDYLRRYDEETET